MLQSERGFGADNLVSARVVLADGSVVVASEDENADLLWGLRGAGHNFGVVTSAELRTFDTPEESWTMVTMWFTGDKLEAYFEAWNRMEEEHDDPGMLVINGHVLMNPEIDPENVKIPPFIFERRTSLLTMIMNSLFSTSSSSTKATAPPPQTTSPPSALSSLPSTPRPLTFPGARSTTRAASVSTHPSARAA